MTNKMLIYSDTVKIQFINDIKKLEKVLINEFDLILLMQI